MSASSFLHPLAAMRIIRALIKSKIARRSMLPKDIWKLKGVPTGGADARVYGKLIEYYWGVHPLEIYGGTESGTGIVATQLWDYGSMTFLPHSDFLEFIPEEDSIKGRGDSDYEPQTLLLNEVKPNETYEIVMSNFYGGALIRYRPDDLIKIVSLKNEKLGIEIPQMVFYSRASEVIDLAGFARLTERTIWEAIESSGVKYTDWVVRKEIKNQEPVLHFYVELKDEQPGKDQIRNMFHVSLKKVDSDYRDIEKILQLKALDLTILSPGTFQRYVMRQQQQGADLGQIKPCHMNPSDKAIRDLLELSKN